MAPWRGLAGDLGDSAMIFMNHLYVEFETPDIEPAIDFYSNDLPNVNVVDEELQR